MCGWVDCEMAEEVCLCVGWVDWRMAGRVCLCVGWLDCGLTQEVGWENWGTIKATILPSNALSKT